MKYAAEDFVCIEGFRSEDCGDEDAHFYDKPVFTVLVPVALPLLEAVRILPDFDSFEVSQLNAETGDRESTYIRASRAEMIRRYEAKEAGFR